MDTAFGSKQLDALGNEALTALEIAEARLLSWGFANVRSRLNEEIAKLLDDLPATGRELWARGQEAGVQPAAVLQNLIDRKLIFRSDESYRSRFAETVRLLYLLRQLLNEKEWANGPRLVSDMRLQLQRRRYPRRNVQGAELEKALKELKLSPLHLRGVQQLLQETPAGELRLARFQVDAIVQQFRNLRTNGDHGIVIAAGTGAGKTKAAYIPAMAEIATQQGHTSALKMLSLYPRVELLKDQVAEAFSEARKLDGLLRENNLRPITIGAYYADTPVSAQAFLGQYPPEGWQRTKTGDGWICPYFFCPNPSCSKRDLVWRLDDIKEEAKNNGHGQCGGYARLHCPSCGTEVTNSQFLLTRQQMVQAPPDILFTTTEMLNRRLSRASEHALFGIDTVTSPRLVLLDEIHTYEGMMGAQVAYLLRRWRHARGCREGQGLCMIGLSATLTQGERFFARLTGLPEYQINYISPQEDDLIEEGVEYNLVLRGDPASGTSLLSTSVQTAMLLARVLDPADPKNQTSVSHGAYGSRIFAFTDKLDVINRWYHIEVDAEKKQNLSRMRLPPPNEDVLTRVRRNEMGQDWWMCREIGHDLRAPLRLGLTSSQYRGVRPNADLVIATSTLEVGFNDPSVGAIMQHKAPRSLASFLQRKGRAGRTRSMRPWTLVVTSAYGRDRWAFQHAETLFNPILPPIQLPLENYYVRKVQAAFALMDWLALMLKKEGQRADIWQVLTAKARSSPETQKHREIVCRLIGEVLQGSKRGSLEDYLVHALGLDNDPTAMFSILWGEPRPLLLDVLPTIVRQLESNWQRMAGGKIEPRGEAVDQRPLPEYVPAQLFGDLSMRELLLHVPGTPGREASSRPEQYLPLAQALVEYAPGHVNKRFARADHTDEAHWLPLPDPAQLSRGQLPLEYLPAEWERVPATVEIEGTSYEVFRPLYYDLAVIPANVRPTSSAWLSWRSSLHPRPSGTLPTDEGREPVTSNVGDPDEDAYSTTLELARHSNWKALLRSAKAYTQANSGWIEVTRVATGIEADTRYTKGEEVRQRLRFEFNGKPAGPGFSFYADGLRFEFTPLDPISVLDSPNWPELYQHLGADYFLHRLRHDPRLIENELSSFEIGWLWQLELSMLVATAVTRQITLPEAAAVVQAMRLALATRTMQVIFQAQQISEAVGDEDGGRLRKRLAELLERQGVVDALVEHEAVLWQPHETGLGAWLREVYAASLGTALFEAVTRFVPDIEPDDLVLDVQPETIWITEASAGGVGLISRIADAIAERPRNFDLQLLDVLRHCEREELAVQLRDIARLVEAAEPGLKNAFARARTETDIPQLNEIRHYLARVLDTHGIPATRELLVALNAKYLRPNSGPDTDRLISTLVNKWEEEEERLGCAIDLRVMAVAAPRIPEIEQQVQAVLRRIGGTAATDENQIFNLLQSLMWLRCHDSCPACIEKYHPYQNLATPSRALLISVLRPRSSPLVYGVPGWQEQFQEILAENHEAELVCEQGNLAACKHALLDLMTAPIEVGYQLFFPVIEAIDRSHQSWTLRLAIRELAGN